MSKRNAHGPQGQKETGLDFNMSSAPDDKPQRATAAQLASRKIKTLRRTRPAAPTPNISHSLSPFSTIDPNVVSSTSSAPSSAPQNQSLSNGFTFGQSQSFPGANPSSQLPQNGTQSVAFGSGAPSNFNFSSSFASGAAPKNPFASMKGDQNASGPGFGGFKGSFFNVPGAVNPIQSTEAVTLTGGPSGSQSPQKEGASLSGNSGAMTPAPKASLKPFNGVSKSPNAFGSPGDTMHTSPDGRGTPTSAPGNTAVSGSSSGGTATLSSTQAKPLFGNLPSEKGLFSLNQSTTQPLFGAVPAVSASTSGTSRISFGNVAKGDASQASSAARAPAPAPGFSLFTKNSTSPAAAAQSSSSNSFVLKAPEQQNERNPLEPKPTTGIQSTSQASQARPFDNILTQKPAVTDSVQEKEPLTQAPSVSIFAPKAVPRSDTTPQDLSENLSNQKPFLSNSAAAASIGDVANPKVSTTVAASAEGTKTTAPVFSVMKSLGPHTSLLSEQVNAAPPGAMEKHQGTNGLRGLPTNLNPKLKADVEAFYKTRKLNEFFKRKISELDPSVDDFDPIVRHYIRARQTLGTPIHDIPSPVQTNRGGITDNANNGGSKTFLKQPGHNERSSTNVVNVSSQIKAGLPETTPASLEAQSEQTSNKRKAAEDIESCHESAHSPEKRARNAGEPQSMTASIFANSFSSAKTSTSLDSSKASEASIFKFKATASAQGSQPNASTASTKFYFDPKPSPTYSNSTVGAVTTAAPTAKMEALTKPVFEMPKFNPSMSGNFLDQFKKNADAEAAKEKAKRKAEDFDSDDDDEAEWERKDAEEQRQKQKRFEALPRKRTKFIHGKGFVFCDSESDSENIGEPLTLSESKSKVTSSIFGNSNDKYPSNHSNPFGHLSATNSEVDGDDATDEDGSDVGDGKNGNLENKADAPSKEPAASTAPSGDASGDDSYNSDLANELERELMAEADITSSKYASDTSSSFPASSLPGGRSLFDRIEYGQDGKPKRRVPPEKKAGQNPLTDFFSTSKFASSFNTPGAAAGNTFSASTTGGSKNVLAPGINSADNAHGSGSGSGSDNTWKVNSPIKFGSKSSDNSAPVSKIGSALANPVSDSSKPLSTLFGGELGSTIQQNATPVNQAAASDSQPSTLGFDFGGPSQPTSSFLAPSVSNSNMPSRSSTPGITSDTGADDSGDGDATEADPQIDLTRGGAGEEDEDLLFETRARALKFESRAWQTRGLGLLRILKHKTAPHSRILVRAQPSGKVVVNAPLMHQINYTSSGCYVQFPVTVADGPAELWAVKVIKEDVDRLLAIIEECKAS